MVEVGRRIGKLERRSCGMGDYILSCVMRLCMRLFAMPTVDMNVRRNEKE